MSNSDWTMTNPINHSLNSTWPDEVRNLKDLLKSRLIAQDGVPGVRTDSVAFTSADHGSIWFDTNSSPDNLMYVLTDYTTPTVGNGWTPVSTEIIATLLASAREFTAALSVKMADATFTVENTDAEDGAGERDSVLQFKGTQSGDEVTTLAKITVSHSGTADDEAGKIEIALNDGADTNAPSSKALTLYTDPAESADAFIDVANSKIVLDEDDLTSDSAIKIATQQSIKAYVDAQDAAALAAGGTAKAWVVFNGTGANEAKTPAASFNVTSVTKTDTGDYTIVWDTDFGSSNYAITGTASGTANSVNPVTPTTEQLTITVHNNAGSPIDSSLISIIVFGAQ